MDKARNDNRSHGGMWHILVCLLIGIYVSSFIFLVNLGQIDVSMPGHHFRYIDFNGKHGIAERTAYCVYWPAYRISRIFGCDLVHTEIMWGSADNPHK